MKSQPINLTYEIELQPGEALTLPPELTASIGAGRWLITIQPSSNSALSNTQPTRTHDAFLRSYAAEDEGLYDDYTR
jgi:D-lyxose ketol-isomerase